jgi:hypothetical protein
VVPALAGMLEVNIVPVRNGVPDPSTGVVDTLNQGEFDDLVAAHLALGYLECDRFGKFPRVQAPRRPNVDAGQVGAPSGVVLEQPPVPMASPSVRRNTGVAASDGRLATTLCRVAGHSWLPWHLATPQPAVGRQLIQRECRRCPKVVRAKARKGSSW